MATKKAPYDVRRARLEQARQEAAKAERRRRQRTILAAGAAVVVVGGGIAAGVTLAHPASHSGMNAIETMAAAGGTGPMPWALPADASGAIKAAGLSPLSSEGSAEHYHAHLDLIVNGKKVSVPADIGIDEHAQRISALHTHDDTGVIHIESPTKGDPYYLGQLFREWDVALTKSQIGGLHVDASHTLKAYVNGKPVSGDPADIKLAGHQEIALVYGPANEHVNIPSTYDFSNL